jgi:4-amino-4-deoxy-L-arabinose transferase-like glycosyltransferase
MIVLVGALLRLRRYLQDRGLMHDDAQLASNIFSRSLAQLLRPLDIGGQAAPAGFLILQKCSVLLFGHGERAIRLVPFVAAVIVLPLFFLTIRKIAGNRTATISAALLALAEPLVRYSAEAKQYSTDVLWTTVVLALALSADGPGPLAILAVAGAVLLWFSHPLLFVLGGVGLTLLIKHLHARRYDLARIDVAIGIAWLASFALNYLLISRYYVSSDFLQTYWQKQSAFAPVPDSVRGILWYPKTLASLFNYPLGILPSDHSQNAARIIASVAVAAFLFGCFVMGRRWKRTLGFMILTILLALAASAVHRYPFDERLTLFCAPLIILPLAFALGIDWWWRSVARSIFWILICAVLFVYPVYIQAKYAVHPEVRYDAKPAMSYVKEHWKQGDSLYLHWGSDVLGAYYLNADPALNIAGASLVKGVFEPNPTARRERYAHDLLQLQGRARVWVVFSMDPARDRPVIEQILNARGSLLDHKQFNGSTVDLYDLR